MGKYTDQEVLDSLLLKRVAKRDREALSEVYQRFQRPLFSYLFHLLGQKELAEDVLQEVVVIVWQKAHTFQGTGQAAHWIFGIAHHQAFKALRHDAHAPFVELETALDLPDEAQNPETDLLRQARTARSSDPGSTATLANIGRWVCLASPAKRRARCSALSIFPFPHSSPLRGSFLALCGVGPSDLGSLGPTPHRTFFDKGCQFYRKNYRKISLCREQKSVCLAHLEAFEQYSSRMYVLNMLLMHFFPLKTGRLSRRFSRKASFFDSFYLFFGIFPGNKLPKIGYSLTNALFLGILPLHLPKIFSVNLSENKSTHIQTAKHCRQCLSEQVSLSQPSHVSYNRSNCCRRSSY